MLKGSKKDKHNSVLHVNTYNKAKLLNGHCVSERKKDSNDADVAWNFREDNIVWEVMNGNFGIRVRFNFCHPHSRVDDHH